MRLSEKTIEINFCTQLSSAMAAPHWWFGLTQAQEKALGWDVASTIRGRWVLFQLKASAHLLANSARRFRGHHHQLVELQEQARKPQWVLYVFPTIGTTDDLIRIGYDLRSSLRFLDVRTIPAIGYPTTRSGSLRKNELHYFDLDRSGRTVTIHSDPIEVAVFSAEELLRTVLDSPRDDGAAGLEPTDASIGDVQTFIRGSRNRVALLLPW